MFEFMSGELPIEKIPLDMLTVPTFIEGGHPDMLGITANYVRFSCKVSTVHNACRSRDMSYTLTLVLVSLLWCILGLF